MKGGFTFNKASLKFYGNLFSKILVVGGQKRAHFELV